MVKVDGSLMGVSPKDAAKQAKTLESQGYDGVFTAETDHDPFFPLLLAAEHSETLHLGTAITVAFPRSPMQLAQTAYDLTRYSDGRFTLGLGSQIKAHIEKRFSATWSKPADRMLDYISALRAIWDCWAHVFQSRPASCGDSGRRPRCGGAKDDACRRTSRRRHDLAWLYDRALRPRSDVTDGE
jgi:alkanesulfonate monooxygenase SsuD/methylene tetrahydromethanopterin reductase-like flavin-dependent oxidoreductase (luciferase family)